MKDQTRKQRTALIIEKFKDNADEFKMLKGVLCMDHGWDSHGWSLLSELIDTVMIAERMDAINKEYVY